MYRFSDESQNCRQEVILALICCLQFLAPSLLIIVGVKDPVYCSLPFPGGVFYGFRHLDGDVFGIHHHCHVGDDACQVDVSKSGPK